MKVFHLLASGEMDEKTSSSTARYFWMKIISVTDLFPHFSVFTGPSHKFKNSLKIQIPLKMDAKFKWKKVIFISFSNKTSEKN